jgi:Flp pilus assembly protein TadB
LTRPLLAALAALAALVVILLAAALWFQHRAKVEKAKAEAATAQVQVEQEASQETEALRQQTIIIRERGDVAVQHIYETPNAETPVPADVLSAWRSGIDGVRGKETPKPGDPPAVP